MQEAIVRVLDRLPFALVQALWLVEICQRSYEEAAEELSTSPEVIGERVAAARRSIRFELLERANHPDPEQFHP